MANTIPKVVKRSEKTSAPALSLEAREQQLKNLAMNEAEKMIRDGQATSQLITTILKMDMHKDRLEKEQMEKDIALKDARIAELEASKSREQLYEEVIAAMKTYSGNDDSDNGDDEYGQ